VPGTGRSKASFHRFHKVADVSLHLTMFAWPSESRTRHDHDGGYLADAKRSRLEKLNAFAGSGCGERQPGCIRSAQGGVPVLANCRCYVFVELQSRWMCYVASELLYSSSECRSSCHTGVAS
jgi:hypothetical protein